MILSLVQAFVILWLPVELWKYCPGSSCPILSFNLLLDNLSVVVLLTIAIILFVTTLVGYNTVKGDNSRFNFVNLLITALIGLNGIVLVTDLFSMYVFMEVISIASFILIAMEKDKDALEGTFKYIVLSMIATVLMLMSLAVLILISGGTSFVLLKAVFQEVPHRTLAVIAAVLFMAGLFIKGGLVPFHGWVPDAYSSAPNAVSVFLAGIVTKTAGIYTMIRLVTAVFGFSGYVKELLLIFGALSIVAGAFAALGQNDFKRMLAYSSISQVGYIIIGLGTGSVLGIAGAVFHFFNHAVFKSLLFINAAAVEKQTGTRDMDKLGGLAGRMPVTGGSSIVAALSTSGIPPLSGFWSKLIIIIALWKSADYLYAVIAVLASLLTLAYFLYLQKKIFFGKLAAGLEGIKEVDMGLLIPQVILALIIIGVGLLFPIVLKNLILPIGL